MDYADSDSYKFGAPLLKTAYDCLTPHGPPMDPPWELRYCSCKRRARQEQFDGVLADWLKHAKLFFFFLQSGRKKLCYSMLSTLWKGRGG